MSVRFAQLQNTSIALDLNTDDMKEIEKKKERDRDRDRERDAAI